MKKGEKPSATKPRLSIRVPAKLALAKAPTNAALNILKTSITTQFKTISEVTTTQHQTKELSEFLNIKSQLVRIQENNEYKQRLEETYKTVENPSKKDEIYKE